MHDLTSFDRFGTTRESFRATAYIDQNPNVYTFPAGPVWDISMGARHLHFPHLLYGANGSADRRALLRLRRAIERARESQGLRQRRPQPPSHRAQGRLL